MELSVVLTAPLPLLPLLLLTHTSRLLAAWGRSWPSSWTWLCLAPTPTWRPCPEPLP